MQPLACVGLDLVDGQGVSQLGLNHDSRRWRVAPPVLQIRPATIFADDLGQPETAAFGYHPTVPDEAVQRTGSPLQAKQPADAARDRDFRLHQDAKRHQRSQQTVGLIGVGPHM